MNRDNMTEEEYKKIGQIIKDAKKLYDISEAEYYLLQQLAGLVQVLDYSCELKIKLLKALAFISEAVHEVTCMKDKK